MAIKYRIVRASNPNSVVDEVNTLLEDGWVPLGGIAVRPTTQWSEREYVQALTKEIPNGN
jgi:hypothetical protein